MKLLATLKRLARLGLFVGAGTALFVIDACGAASRRPTDADATPDADTAPDSDRDQDIAQDAEASPQDADEDERWDVPLE